MLESVNQVSCDRLPDKKRKDKMDAWIKKINKSVLHKANPCLFYSFYGRFLWWKSKTKAVSPRDKLKYLLKPDAFPSLPAHWKVGNKARLFSLVAQDTNSIKFRKVNNFLFNFLIKKSQKQAFQYRNNTHNECFRMLI